ncbi:hypothetical protein [Geobacter pickeringii]|uniref:Uncharacterized protein n=1 Tax=Geobacter pickeringii TaxID=345632 RepID=A0A0B5BFZ1_9BACT|nr:hypothetical protein [Geobacter pickeringii]AJE03440.1 hypothetical protein GPICK_08810 [Geobacter pickeringii]
MIHGHQDEDPIPADIFHGLLMGQTFKARQAEDWQRLQKAFADADNALWRGDIAGMRDAFAEERRALMGFRFS